jgi:hypothetical protein
VDFKLPKLEQIMDFKTSFLKKVTKKARDMHLDIIKTSWRSPDGRKFPKLTKKYAKEKQKKYGNKNPNLFASGLLFKQIVPFTPKRSNKSSDVNLSYGIKSSSKHPRKKGDSISSIELMGFHQSATPPNKLRNITAEGSFSFSGDEINQNKVIHNLTRDMIVKGLVNQISKNIVKALKPHKVTIDL